MSLLFIDSFDHYTTADITEKWGQTVGEGEIRAGFGRRGTSAYYSSLDRRYLGKTFAPAATWIVGFSLRCTGYLSTTILAQWSDVDTAQSRVRVTSNGQIELVSGSTLLARSSMALSVNTTYYLEWLLTVHNTSGVSTVRIDGVVVASASGVKTQESAQALANTLHLGNINVASVLWDLCIDDVYICRDQSTFLGDCRVDVCMPNGEGSHSAWVPSAGTTHYEVVDEIPANDDTDYLSSSTLGARDSQVFTDLPAMPDPLIYGVQHALTARKDDVGTRQVKSLVKSGATVALGATTHTLATTYVAYTDMYETDPATGLAWTVAAVNAVEAGAEVV